MEIVQHFFKKIHYVFKKEEEEEDLESFLPSYI
jgi:hypothetical protein